MANVLQVMLGLVVVLGIIFSSAWLLRRFGQGSLLVNQHMKVVSSLSLGTRERVVMIEVGGQQILLGVAPGRISKLHIFTEPAIDTVSSDRHMPAFGQKIREIMDKGKTK